MKPLKFLIVFLSAFAALIAPKAFPAHANEIATEFEFVVENKTIKFNSFDICKDKQLLEKWNRNKGGDKIKSVGDKILKMGFSDAVCVQFLFPGMEQVFDALEKKINTAPENAKIEFNNQTLVIKREKFGNEFLREETAKRIIDNLKKGTNKIEVAIKKNKPEYCYSDLENCKNLRSQFSTWCGNSSSERKNNIEIALQSINNIQILPGETFSFNNATGVRNEEKGYQKAKIISNGKFIEGTGGGVCQVSTTLYNAALLAGLEIEEVHQHSLPVSYVSPSRDAMVNGFSSDLKIKNTSAFPISINAKLINNQDIVIRIFGAEDNSKFSIESKVLNVIQPEKDEISSDKSLVPFELKNGESYRVSSPKCGIESEAYLIEKDNKGNITRRTKLRHNRYNPTKGIIVVG